MLNHLLMLFLLLLVGHLLSHVLSLLLGPDLNSLWLIIFFALRITFIIISEFMTFDQGNIYLIWSQMVNDSSSFVKAVNGENVKNSNHEFEHKRFIWVELEAIFIVGWIFNFIVNRESSRNIEQFLIVIDYLLVCYVDHCLNLSYLPTNDENQSSNIKIHQSNTPIESSYCTHLTWNG